MRLIPCILALAGAPAGWTAQVTLAQADLNTADILISGVSPLVVGAFSLTLSFSPALVSITGAQSQGHLGTSGLDSFWSTQSLTDQFRIEEVSLLTATELAPLQPATFSLARISFQLPASGVGVIDLSGIIGDADGNPISTTFVQGTLVDVPEPGSLILLTAGMVVLLRRSPFG